MLTLEEPKTCLKCSHTRTPQDTGPDYMCPKCGAIYAKLEAAARAKQAAQADEAARRQEKIEQQEWEKANAGEIARLGAQTRSQKRMAHFTYLLYALPFGITLLVGVILAHVMSSSVRGTWIESHYDWLAGTFWKSLLAALALWTFGWIALGGTLIMAGARGAGAGMAGAAGMVIFFKVAVTLLVIWFIYRVVKGWLYLLREDAMA